jgi:hypothetical protein
MVRDLVVESEQQQCLLTIHDLLKLIIQLLSTAYNATKWVAEYGNEIELMEND